jgi:CubicO group peptidase (beta-lactamase class C family)
VEQAVDQGKIPGASVLVLRHGKTVAARRFGTCDLETSRPFQQDTICWIASLTKPVTATAAMILVEQGKLGLDDPVEKYLPEFGALKTGDGTPATVTVRQLMCHASGIGARVPLRPGFFFTQSWYDRSIGDVASAIAGRPLLFKPGEKVLYSNAAPYVLARIIEIQSGQPFGEFVNRQVLARLGMEDTGFAVPGDKVDRVAVVYRREKGESVVYCRYDKDWEVRMCMPDGGLFSTPADIARFAGAFMPDANGVLSADSVRTMLGEQSDGYGLGWIRDRDGQFSHWGSSGTLVWADHTTGSEWRWLVTTHAKP